MTILKRVAGWVAKHIGIIASFLHHHACPRVFLPLSVLIWIVKMMMKEDIKL